MNVRLDAIGRRRVLLLQEITGERERTAQTLSSLRSQVALAGVGILAARLLRRSRWFRLFSAAAAVASVALPVVARLLAARR
jgi:hypothetical protein